MEIVDGIIGDCVQEEMSKFKAIYRREFEKVLHRNIIEPIEIEMGTHC